MILAIDQGTTTTKALAVELLTGNIVASISTTNSISFPAPGSVEQDAEQIWNAVREVAAAAAFGLANSFQGIAISSQRESVVAWSKSSGLPLAPVLGWQDARTAQFCEELAEHSQKVLEITGLALDPMFSAPKIRWLLDHLVGQGIDVDDIAVGTVDSWLIFRLTGNHFIEIGNASRTLLMNLETGQWDGWLLDLFGIPEHVLPQIVPSIHHMGVVAEGIPGLEEFTGVPVLATLADSHAALLVHHVPGEQVAKATFGTGTSVMATSAMTDADVPVSSTVAWQLNDQMTYASEGNIIASGSCLDWTARMLGCPDGVVPGKWIVDLAQTVDSTESVQLIPGFSGLGAPYWNRSASGSIVGLSLGSGPAHVARAATEAVAHQVCDVIEAIEQASGMPIGTIVADGGASASSFLMQLQADLSGKTVEVSPVEAASAYGAAKAAAMSLGIAPWEKASVTFKYTPQLNQEARDQSRTAWKLAMQRATKD